MVELRIKGVSCRYNSVPVLDGVELSVESGDFVGILGPNGSGKTTLLRTIARALKPSLGVVLIDGEDIYSMKPREVARKIAVVPQDSFVSFNFTALEVVLMGRNPYLKPIEMETVKDLMIARRAMSATNSLHLAERRINDLSGGERRMVIIARALAQEPQILLLDEPTLNLDVNHQLEIMEMTRQLCDDRGLAVLSVFHDFNLAARYSDQILLLNDGMVFSLGAPEEVLTAENIRCVFMVDAEVSRHPVTRLNVTVLSGWPPKRKEREGFDSTGLRKGRGS